MNDLQVTVIAHGAAQETFDRHLPIWMAHKAPILVVCPANDPVKTDLEIMAFAEAERAGRQAHARLRRIHEFLCHKPMVRYHLICEYDSFLLSDPVRTPGLWGIMQMNYESPKFMAHRYPNPPWLIDTISLLAMWETSEKYPALYEGGEADRYWAALAELSGIPMLDYAPRGFTRGTITPTESQRLQDAVRAGAFAFHGVKDRHILAFILSHLKPIQAL